MAKSKESRYKPKSYTRTASFTQDGDTYKITVTSDYEDAELDPSVSFPGYKRSIALGTPASTLRSGITESIDSQSWSTFNVYDPGPFSDPIFRSSRGTDIMPGPAHARFLSYDPSVASAASAQFLAAAANAAHQFDGGQFLGEFMKTVNLVSSPLKSIVKLAKSHKGSVQKHLRGAQYESLTRQKKKNIQSVVYDSYLEFVYGVKPLMSDVSSALDTAIESQRKVIRVPVSGHYSETKLVAEFNETAIADENVSNADIFRKTTIKATYSCRIIGAIVILNGNNPVENFAKNSGLGLDNFLPTIYNLLPFSFLLDYFSNAGDIIQATSAYRLNHAWSNTTQMIEVDAGSKLWHRASGTLPVGASNSYTVEGGDIRLKSRRWKREGGFPVVDLQALKFNLPSANQLLNIAALVGSLHQSTNGTTYQ